MDREIMHGSLQSTTMQRYELHEITTSGGTVIHEYMTLQGKIFAVTWYGPFPPNLQQLFGSYYQQFQGAAPAATHFHGSTHRMLSIVERDLVIREFARMRSYRGKAFVPSLIPAGVSIGALP
jgi:Protein of unknown function (DUF2844)